MSAVAIKNDAELVPTTAPVTIFRTDNPNEVVTRAAETANALASVVRSRKLTVKIQGRQHVLVEGWTLLGSMLGVFPVCVWTKKLDNGWEARVEARTRDGAVIGAAEAMCVRSEKTWAQRDDYALRSMAQTRATSKALRQPLGFVMTMAGFEATPAEEMVIDDVPFISTAPPPKPGPFSPAAPTDDADPVCSEPQAKKVWALIRKLEKAGILTEEQIRTAMVPEYGTNDPRVLTKSQASDLIKRLEAKEGE